MNSISCSKLSKISNSIINDKIFKQNKKVISNKLLGIKSEKNLENIFYDSKLKNYILKKDNRCYKLIVNNFIIKSKFDGIIHNKNDEVIGFVEYKRRINNILTKKELIKRENDLIQLAIYKKTFIYNFHKNPKIYLIQENNYNIKIINYSNSSILDKLFNKKINKLSYE